MYRIPGLHPRYGYPARGIRSTLTAASLIAACATCDASTALAPPALRAVAMAWEGDTVLVAGSSQPAAFVVMVDGVLHPVARLRLASSDTDVVAVGSDGETLTARLLGVATLTATLLDATLPSPPPSLVTTLVVSPAVLRLTAPADTLRSLGDTVRLAIGAIDAVGGEIAGLTAQWSSSDTLIATVSSDGLVTGTSNGSVEIRARVGSLIASATVVTRQRAAALRFAPGSLLLDALGADSVIAATVLDARGSELRDLSPSLVWSSGSPAVATVVEGRVTALTNGATWARVSAGTLRDSMMVDVRQRATRVVVESPSPLTMQSIGETAVMRARAYDRRDNEVLIAAPTWRSLNPLVVHVEAPTGIATGLGAGTATLVAELDGASASATATVADVPARVVLTPDLATLTSVGDTLQLAWVVQNARGVAISGVAVTLRSTDTTIVRALDGPRATGVGTGTARLIAATATGVADTALVTVVNAVAHVAITPDLATLGSVGDTVIPPASVRNERGAELPRSAATWASDDAGVARVSAGGVVIASGPGETVVRATSPYYPDRRDSLTIVVTNAPASVVIERDADLVTAVGASRTYAVEVRNARGGLLGVTPEWRTLDAAVARVSTTGLVTTAGVGTARIVAAAGLAADTLLLTVRDDIAGLDISPGTATMTSVGDVLHPVVTARNSLGQVVSNPPLTWVSTDTTVLRTTSDAGVLAAGVGIARVIVATGGLADTAIVTVINAVAHVAITPDLVSLSSVGDTVVPAASIRNERGAELARSAATWTSDNAAVARVTAAGTITAVGAGETHIRATSPTYPDRRDSVAVLVTNAPAIVVIDRGTDLLTSVGAVRAYTAEVRNAAGSLIGTTPAWRSLEPAVASVNASGSVTSTGVGTARIVASAGTAADTLVLTVRDDVVYVEVAPSSATLTSLGDVLHPVATARNALGTVVANPSLAWMSADTTVAKLLSDGGVLAVGPGSTRIVASAGTVADTMLLSVTNLPVLIDIAGAADTILAVGDSAVLSVMARNARGDSLSTTSLAWSIDDPVVARVSSTGTVTARAVGSTWVRASGGTAKDSIWMVVTNEPAGVVMTLAATGASATVDTMTAAGQALDYDATATNRIGLLIPDAVLTWRSTDPAVASVSPTGVATAMGFGSAWVIAQAGTAADSVRLVVADARRVYVDNAIVVASRFGTLARPYATIQDGVNAASVDDTVIVFRGNSYSESVTLGRRVTLLGDSAAFVAGGRDPLLLPLLRHDLGAAGITMATPGASFNIRYFGIQHSVDGEAIAARDADNLVVSDVYVNPIPGFRTGRGILVEGAAGTVSISRSRVDSVYAFGIRIRDAANAQLQNVTVRGVAARSGYAGAGLEITGGSAVVSSAVIRRTAGPQVHFTRTAGASLLTSTLTGEQQLVRLDSVRGTTTVRGNTFDMRLQAGETSPTRGSGADPSALEIVGSSGVLVDANVFTGIGGQSSLMDGVRLADVRVGTSGAAHGALLTGNRFRGGRTAVRSARSSWELRDSRIDSTSVGVLLAEADTVTLSRDTIAQSRVAAVQSTGAAARLVMTMNEIAGAQRAIVASGAADVVLRNNTIVGSAFTGFAQPALGAVDIGAGAAVVVGNAITGIRGWTALVLRDGAVRADSNFVARNIAGVRLGAASLPTLAGNTIFDNDTLPASARRAAIGVVNEGVPRILGKNWWGAPEGPQSDAPLAPAARGDSVIGGVTADTLMAPIVDHRGTGVPLTLRKVAGDPQSGTIGVPLPVLLTGRVVDAAGRPLAGVPVTFSVDRLLGNFTGGTRSGSLNVVSLVTDASGLAGAEYTPLASGGAAVTATFDKNPGITFTVTVP